MCQRWSSASTRWSTSSLNSSWSECKAFLVSSRIRWRPRSLSDVYFNIYWAQISQQRPILEQYYNYHVGLISTLLNLVQLRLIWVDEHCMHPLRNTHTSRAAVYQLVPTMAQKCVWQLNKTSMCNRLLKKSCWTLCITGGNSVISSSLKRIELDIACAMCMHKRAD